MKKLKDEIKNLIRPIFSKKGKIFAEIVINWSEIVGPQYSKNLYPCDFQEYKSNNGITKTLVIKSESKSQSLNLKFSETIFVERINAYFGTSAISNIKFI